MYFKVDVHNALTAMRNIVVDPGEANQELFPAHYSYTQRVLCESSMSPSPHVLV